jgi:ribonucleotide monophosphatase NagD (HAD superfamily)
MPFDFSPYPAVLLDLDGTLCHDDHPLPGAADLVRTLGAMGKKVGVISNSGSGPLRVQMRLHAMNVEVDSALIYTAAAHAADTIVEMFPRRLDETSMQMKRPAEMPRDTRRARPRVFNLATDSIGEMLDGMVDWVTGGGEPCDCILVAAPTAGRYTQDAMRIALQLARNGGAAIVGLCADRVYPSRRGLEFGSGALAAMLAYAANREPIFCGKPQPQFFLHLCRRLNVRPEQCLLVGDNLEADIAGGRAVGMDGVLVLSGVSRRRDASLVPEGHRPVAIIDDLTQLLP